MSSERDDEYREYVAARMSSMRRLAYLMCGDWHRAEDAVQVAFVKLYVKWSRCVAADSLDSYVRRMVINSVKDMQRRHWFHKEHPKDELPDRSNAGEEISAERVVVLNALARLPKRRRATLVLRFWEDLSVDETARIMRCSTATVKSQTARGLHTLRELLADSFHDQFEGATR